MASMTVVTAVGAARSGESGSVGDLVEQLRTIDAPTVIWPFRVVRDGRIEGALAGWLACPEIIRWLRFVARPLPLRVGIGVGPMAEPISFGRNLAATPAYRRSLQALTVLKRTSKLSTLVRTGSPPLNDIANSLFSLIDAIEQSWTERMWQAVVTRDHSGTFDVCAEHLNVRPQSVQESCSRAHWRQVQSAEGTLSNLGRYEIEYFRPKNPEGTGALKESLS